MKHYIKQYDAFVWVAFAGDLETHQASSLPSRKFAYAKFDAGGIYYVGTKFSTKAEAIQWCEVYGGYDGEITDEYHLDPKLAEEIMREHRAETKGARRHE